MANLRISQTAAAPNYAVRGFTILELLVVTAVLAVLFGIGVGFLGRTDPEQIAAAILSGETRAAQLTARAEGLPTEVWITPGREGESAIVQGRVLEPVASWRFEPGEGVADDLLRPQLGGEDEPCGRFGHGRRPGGEGRGPLLRWPIHKDVTDFREGFAVRVDVRLERREAALLLRLGSALELQLDGEARLEARFRVRTGGGGTQGAQVRGTRPLPLLTWCTVEAVCDGREAWLAVDGREIGRVLTDGRPLIEPNESLDVSAADAPIAGAIDEVRLYAHAFSAPQYLPNELQPVQPYRFAYDAQGEAVSTPTVKWLVPEDVR
ncbi:MAG: hypothetical protein RL398_787 [Planctomycetota bacterium]|jgi:prepilin-type N-terminal cleavage/methylation domain-containing protein